MNGQDDRQMLGMFYSSVDYIIINIENENARHVLSGQMNSLLYSIYLCRSMLRLFSSLFYSF
jgi:hypothetical protein